MWGVRSLTALTSVTALVAFTESVAAVSKHVAESEKRQILLGADGAQDQKTVTNSAFGNTHNHFRQQYIADHANYRSDAQDFLASHLHKQQQARCQLPQASMEDAMHKWKKILRQETALWRMQHGDIGSQPPDTILYPWMGNFTPESFSSPVAVARKRFAEEMFNGMPGVINDAAEQWPARTRWSESNVRVRLAGVKFEESTFNYPAWLDTAGEVPKSVAEYMEEGNSSSDKFLFVNEIESPADADDVLGLHRLREDYKPTPPFAAIPEERHSILAIDGSGSSHGFHTHGPVWQTQVQGHKAWWLLSPVTTTFHGLFPMDNGKKFTESNACAFTKRDLPPTESIRCLVWPGETMLVPESWWHATCGLDSYTIAIGGWLEDHRPEAFVFANGQQDGGRESRVQAFDEEGGPRDHAHANRRQKQATANDHSTETRIQRAPPAGLMRKELANDENA